MKAFSVNLGMVWPPIMGRLIVSKHLRFFYGRLEAVGKEIRNAEDLKAKYAIPRH